MVKFQVVKVEDKFRIEDEEGNVYGFYDKKSEAEEDVELWKEYYGTPNFP